MSGWSCWKPCLMSCFAASRRWLTLTPSVSPRIVSARKVAMSFRDTLFNRLWCTEVNLRGCSVVGCRGMHIKVCQSVRNLTSMYRMDWMVCSDYYIYDKHGCLCCQGGKAGDVGLGCVDIFCHFEGRDESEVCGWCIRSDVRFFTSLRFVQNDRGRGRFVQNDRMNMRHVWNDRVDRRLCSE